MLQALRGRYAEKQIFSNIGPVLCVLNPYQQVACCHPDQIKKLSRMDPDALPPHIFTVAAGAYNGLVDHGCPQSILVSGESGAGKTETTKICLACLALCSSSSGKTTDRALESGLLLEAFGNARTVFNNNSSRFGKWCSVNFDARGRMASCALTSFLLEQSRIVSAPSGERYVPSPRSLPSKKTPAHRAPTALRRSPLPWSSPRANTPSSWMPSVVLRTPRPWYASSAHAPS